MVTYNSFTQRYYKLRRRPPRPSPPTGGKIMRSHLLHVAVLIAALGVSTSMFAATLV
jgi:hypothetical protein